MCRKIMVVDDDPSILDTVEMILDTGQYEACFVQNGEQCLETLRNGFQGLILMDIMMPEMDGWDTIAAMVKEGLIKGNVVCMMTAVFDPGPKMDYLKEYILDYVRKPFSVDELLTAVDESLRYAA